ncbi:35295_t:CDS:2, partial [Gigaspora margarita]
IGNKNNGRYKHYWDPERLRFQYFNHILNLAVQAALDRIKKNVSKIRELNSAIRLSPQQLHLRYGQEWALNTLTSSHDDFQSYAISHNQWTALEKIVEFLEPFKDLTIKMSSSSNSTAFWIIPLFNIVFNHVEDVASTVDKSASKIQYQTVG